MRLLWIDDELEAADPLLALLASEGITTELGHSGCDGIQKASASQYDVAIVDLRLPDMFGLSVLDRLVACDPGMPIVVASGHYVEPEMEADVLRRGSRAFVRKPILDHCKLARLLRSATNPSLRRSRNTLRGPIERYGILAASMPTLTLLDWIESITQTRTNSSVLITGESGTGKELVARALHDAGNRRSQPFVAINCAAIADSLADSELFGYRKGAFTGAFEDRAGVFEAAHRGTLFLDEVNELLLSTQAKLLRVLEAREVRRVGDTRTITVDVQIIAATNRSLTEEIRAGRFRMDLYYRLAVATWCIPPLRDRLEDLDELVGRWLPGLSNGRITSANQAAIAALRRYGWPGNVRELRTICERAVLFATDSVLGPADVAAALSSSAPLSEVSARPVSTEGATPLRTALEKHGWNRGATARSLGIDRTTLWRRLRRAGVRRI